MGWEFLQGQDAALASLQRDLFTGRVAGSYVFFGPEGVGKAVAATLFAKALQCTGDSPPCSVCLACGKVERGVHPDVIQIRPAEGSLRVGVAEVREFAVQRAHQRPQEGRRQVFLIDDAHQVTLAAFNALLKSLEEPSTDTVFIIITSNLQVLPQTVVSRSRCLRFRSLSRDELRQILAANLKGEVADVERLISLTLGRLGKVFRTDLEVLNGSRECAMEILTGLSEPPGQADEAGLISLAASFGGRGRQVRSEILDFLEMLLGLLRDILGLKVAPDVLEPWNTDLVEALDAIGSRWGIPGLIKAMDRVRGAIRDVGETNTNPSLTLESLVISLRPTVGGG